MTDNEEGAKFLKQVSLVPYNENNQLITTHAIKAGDPTYLVELAREVSQANSTIKAGACGKLDIIAQQIRFLQEQARQVLLDASTDELINKAACNFIKKPGKIYHLYKREDGKPYLGMLSPEEWGGFPPHDFVGSYKLEYDMTFTPIEKVKKRKEEMSKVEDLFAERHVISDHPPNIDIQRHTNHKVDPTRYINRPSIDNNVKM